MSKNLQAIILCRISDEKQKDGYSLDAQERIGRDYCKSKNFELLQTFRLIETGSKSQDRKKFDQVMNWYKNIRDGLENKHGRKEAKIAIDESTKKAVLRVFELRAVHGYSYYSIKDQILKENLLPEDKAKRFSKSSVETILNNKFYEGQFFWDGEYYQGKHEVFVPLDWIRKSHLKRGKTHTNRFIGPFSHTMTCGVPGCGSSIIYDPKTKFNKTTKEEILYPYYHCADGKRFHKENKIPQVNIPEQKLWDLFHQPIQELNLNEALAGFIYSKLEEVEKVQAESKATVKESASIRLKEVLAKEDELYTDYSDGLLSKDNYLKRLEAIKSEQSELKAKIENVTDTSEQEIKNKAKSLLELCKLAESAWKKASGEERIELVKRVCSNLQLDGASLRYDLKIPFKKLLDLKKNNDFTKWCPRCQSS